MMFAKGQGLSDYCVDIVMCIDATGSMAPIIDEVKKNAKSLYGQFVDGMEIQGKSVGKLRTKIIAFRDYICDSQPMVESDFFELPGQAHLLESFLDGIEACGGGDDPECAFEAISLALKSDWTTDGAKRRHVVVVFTDAPALPLRERAGCPGYPADMPRDFAELSAIWEGSYQLDGPYASKWGRLIAFVPHDESWKKLESWNRFTSAYTSGKGCSDIDMQNIVDTVVGSFDL